MKLDQGPLEAYRRVLMLVFLVGIIVAAPASAWSVDWLVKLSVTCSLAAGITAFAMDCVGGGDRGPRGPR